MADPIEAARRAAHPPIDGGTGRFVGAARSGGGAALLPLLEARAE